MQAYTGKDIIKFNDRIGSDFANGDCAIITFPNELHGMANGKDGNSLAAHNEQGNIAELEMRVIKGSGFDKYLNSFVLAWKNHSDEFAPATAELTKMITTEAGKVSETTSLGFIFPSNQVETRVNTDGDTDQMVSVYRFRAGTSNRALA
ncbi:MAG: hypothetical protein J6S67_11230 [Methanobrevibacter sp.]|nr:hypothetical protein [Methanobrevibacter sp.]